MKRLFKKINWRDVNISAWIVILVAYVYPIQHVENMGGRAGFPYPFITIYEKRLGVNLFSSFHISIGELLFNIAIIYVCINIVRRLFNRIKNPK